MPTCTVAANASQAEPLWHSFTLHHMLIIVGAICAAAACLFSLLLITSHLRDYTRPNEQRQIIRLVFTPFVFAVFSLLAVAFYDYSIYMEALRDYYVAFALVAIFLLFVHFVTPTESQRENFYHYLERRGGKGVVKTGGSLKWFRTIWVGVFQYILGRTITTGIEIITQAEGVFCNSSNSPKFANVWVTALLAFDTIFIIACIITFYRRLKLEMARYKPLSKLVAFKAIVLVSLLQNLFFSFMLSSGHFSPTSTISYNDLAYGIPSALICLETTIFAIVFFIIFSPKPYAALAHLPRPSFNSSRTSIQELVGQESHTNDVPVKLSFARAAADALNPLDFVHGFGYAMQILFGMKKHAGPSQGPLPRQATIPLEPPRNKPQYGYNGRGGAESQYEYNGRGGAEPQYGYSGRGGAAPPQYA